MAPTDVTEEGIFTVVSLRQPLKADSTMLLPDTIVTLVSLEQSKIEVEAKDAGTMREARLTPEKAKSPMEVTEEGIITDDRLVQP